ncbi:MAG: alcohol dehydrogenase catalytic domain-containing protein [Saprospiraceae bacterium]|nr:alcohol dehydrogenase catalytic domain-containing protein [Saprospiraceae bacterium]
MKALTFTGIQSITYEDILDPIIEDQMDVIVKTSYCAICGSDLHIYHGRERGIDSTLLWDMNLPEKSLKQAVRSLV